MIRKLEKYEILEEIGHGGMATVYRARDSVLDRMVALKVMHPHLRKADEAKRRFHREAQSVARLRHDCVLEIYDFSAEGSSEAFIAAELLTGPTLKAWREKREEVPAEVAAALVIEIARALEAAHKANLVHRDVKPENVLLHEGRCLKLTDFGIAEMVDAASMTATGQILGSPGHMAPEQIDGRDTDARTDLFSLGTVLYYLATGRLPFEGRNPHQILKRIVDGNFPDPLRVNPKIGGRLRGIIVRALEREPTDRYQNAGELIDALKAFLEESGIDDHRDLLWRYIGHPARVDEELREQLIPRLTELGQKAAHEGSVPLALDHYNRVLALDDGNAKVLRLIQKVGVDRRRKQQRTMGLALALLGLAAGGAAYFIWPSGSSTAGTGVADASAPEPDAGQRADAAALAGDSGASVPADRDASVDESVDAGVDAGVAEARDPRVVRPPVSREPRMVIFAVTPAAVRIGVDGSSPRAFGGDFHSVELRPGSHVFDVRAPAAPNDHWQSRSFTRQIPPGTGDYRLELELPFADSAILVQSNVPADVEVVGRTRGRTGRIISVPMTARQQNLLVRISADGHRSAEQRVQLTAGRTASDPLRVTLLPE